MLELSKKSFKKGNTLSLSQIYVDGDEVLILPIETFEQAAQLQAGAVGSNFRGGRVYEAAPVIDGVSIKDPSAGYTMIRAENVIQTSWLLP